MNNIKLDKMRLIVVVSMLVSIFVSSVANADGGASAHAAAHSDHDDYDDHDDLHHHHDNSHQHLPTVTNEPLNRLKRTVAAQVSRNPNLFDPEDVESFLHDHGAVAARQFMAQRSLKWRRAARLAVSALKRRKILGVQDADADDFPCDLFALGLIFENGRAHHQGPDGQYVEGNPVIWIRVGALGSVVKHLEKFTPSRLISYAYNTPRDAISKLTRSISSSRLNSRRQRRNRIKNKLGRSGDGQRIIKNNSVKEHQTVTHIMRAIAWWLDDWVTKHPEGSKATLVLDFEDTDFAFASWSVGEFFVKLDDIFPNLFDQIIGFRYKPKLWSLHSPISMFNRIFKSRFSSSPETDAKLKFVSTEPQMSMFMPRVDARGFTMLPEHVQGTCMEPDMGKAPAGCSSEPSANGLYDPSFWQAVHNEFYHVCRPKARN